MLSDGEIYGLQDYRLLGEMMHTMEMPETIRPISRTGAGNVQNSESTSSSGSSTIEGTASPPQKSIDEETPLLHHGHALPSLYPRRTTLSSINGFLMYQPRPIPFFNKILPSNGSSVAIISLIAINLFYIFFHVNFSIFELFVLADRFWTGVCGESPLVISSGCKEPTPSSSLKGGHTNH